MPRTDRRRRPFATLTTLPLLLAAGALVGCHQRPDQTPTDGAADAAPFDAPAGDGIAPLSLDFTATGCDTFDLGASRCAGAAPLTVIFSPIGSPSLTQFLWDFGDGTPTSKARAPTHTYTLPGSFTVTLVGDGASGSLSRMHTQFIVVAVATLGQRCDVDAQCDTGLRCLCGSTADCGDAFARGLCVVDCAPGACASGAVCADLWAGAPTDPAQAAPYQRALCLSACADDTTCAPGLHCRQLPSGGGGPAAAAPAWVRGCFAPVPADVGQPCRSPDGTLSAAACTSGQCVDLGALGLCTATCDAAGGCPDGSACALFGDGRSLCLQACAADADCADDPLFRCQASASSTGALGFTLVAPSAAAMVCAPMPCQADADCQPSGACTDGHCHAL
ncbi:MAG TPA: PKD domain-containing protein [Polyangia bacterium]|jgi:PKD repeat protein|nr:PKD domain-containing protein [Polyangia bacterium]